MENESCSDSGPLIHLNEIHSLQLFKIFSKIHITTIIKEEIKKYEIKLPSRFVVDNINKDQILLISERYGIDLGESSTIWLCKSLNISIFLTDDLEARETAESLDLSPIGTIGIILRSFREDIIKKEDAIILLKEIYQSSSLFVTSSLIQYAIREINNYKKK
ncbi:hypothetical protein HYT56_03145 [Candidatus Woesearchaeota archaeon]|nr:hypothetical protein [Candidatus Woesearchaeota archaeon]